MELTFKEPDTIKVPDYENGERIDKIFEIIPLPVENMKMTVQFQELQIELDKQQHNIEELREKYDKLLKLQKSKGNKKEAVTKAQKKALDKTRTELREATKNREKFIVEELLPAISEIITLGIIDFNTGEPTELPKRHKTLPKMMAIAVRILDLTTETETEVDTNFQKEEPEKKNSEPSEQE